MWLASVALAVVLVLSSSVDASSKPAGRLKRFAHPSTLSIDILPRQQDQTFDNFVKRDPHPHPSTLRYSDSFRLVLAAFDDTFHIHLRPNDHLIHPSARITHYTIDPLTGESVVSHTEPLLRETVKAYEGEVVHGAMSPGRMLEDAVGGVYAPYRQDRGWARIMMHSSGDPETGVPPVFEGVFSVDGVLHHVITKDNYMRTKHPLDPEYAGGFQELDSHLVIWRDSDMMPHEDESSQPKHCGHDDLSYNSDSDSNPALMKSIPDAYNLGLLGNVSFARTDDDWSLSRRDDVAGGGMSSNFINNIGQSTGCSTTQRIIYMGVAADCMYVSQFGTPQNATERILTDWNSATALYKSTFNVSLGIVELQVQNPTCPSTTNTSMAWNVNCDNVELDQRLSLFSEWRGQKGDDGVGLWHLMSGCPTGTEVGIAWLGTLCKKDTSGSGNSISSGTGVSTSGLTEWQVVSHEIGHNFGAIHDCTDGCTTSDSCCPLSQSSCNANKQFIMSPVADSGEHNFSPCTLGNICSLLGATNGQVDSSCLVDASNSNRKLISLQMCGNGVVDDGEECDPGPNPTSDCCDTSTCKFRSGAVCDPDSSACCTGQCSFAPSTQVCRPSKDSKCDTAEMCTGNSSSCPTDVFAPNGQSCGNNGLACASGQCTSIALQCQNVGSSLGLKDACPNHGDTSCRISCKDPNSSNSCVQLNSMLIDGSPCGYAGTCIGGSCKAGSALDVAKAWYRDNLQIAIPVTIVVGIVVLLILWACLRSLLNCCSGRRRAPPSVYPNTPNYGNIRHQRLASSEASAPPLLPVPTYIAGGNSNRQSRSNRLSRQGPTSTSPPLVQWDSRPHHSSRSSRGNWVDPTAYNGPRS